MNGDTTARAEGDPTTGARLGRIGQVALRVHDLDEAVRFYRDSLGLRFLFQVPRMAFFDCDGIRLLLGLPEGEEQERMGSILYFDVDDIAGAHSLLEQAGVAFEQPPHKVADLGERELWLAFFRDPFRNTLALMSEVPRASGGELPA